MLIMISTLHYIPFLLVLMTAVRLSRPFSYYYVGYGGCPISYTRLLVLAHHDCNPTLQPNIVCGKWIVRTIPHPCQFILIFLIMIWSLTVVKFSCC